MSQPVRYLDLYLESSADFLSFFRPSLMQAQLDEPGDPILYVAYPRKESVAIGYNSYPGRDVNVDFCLSEGIVPRRAPAMGGLGSFFHLGTVQIGLMGHSSLPLFSGTLEQIYERYLTAFAQGFQEAWGIDCHYRPLNDIDDANGRKFMGCGVIRRGEYVDFLLALYVSAFPDPAYLERILPQPPEKYKDKQAKGIADRLTSLENVLGRPVGLDEVRQRLLAPLAQKWDLDLRCSPLRDREVALERHARTKFDGEAWFLQKTPERAFAGASGQRGEFTHKCPNGPLIRATVLVEGNHIARLLLTGAYLGVSPYDLTDRLEAAMAGVPLDNESVGAMVADVCAGADVSLARCAPEDFTSTILQAAANAMAAAK